VIDAFFFIFGANCVNRRSIFSSLKFKSDAYSNLSEEFNCYGLLGERTELVEADA